MEQIWAPWRMEYIRMEKPKGCILCEKPARGCDVENYVLHRGSRNFVIMNTYPYNPGHLLIAPYRHLGGLDELDDEERNEHFVLVCRCLELLREKFHPDGFNVGINMGKVAGAGIDSHVHTHVVPRWQGDVNFMPVISDVRVVPEALMETFKKLRGGF
ncbi:MAG: HIT domain-containing protein [Dehalococcoidales bacterium]|nr:HIT domain-containing protein [Dehalococcoidales bacterium]